MNKLIVEFIGTFFLFFIIGITAFTANALAPFAIAFTLMTMIYAGGYISGAHYNPAVSFGLLLARKIKIRQFINYCLVQVAGAASAAGVILTLFASFTSPSAPPSIPNYF